MRRRKMMALTSLGSFGTIACGQIAQQSSEPLSDDRSYIESIQIAAATSTPIISSSEYLKKLPAPNFKSGHTLQPLTRFGWFLPFATRVELADRWGYTLEWGPDASRHNVTQAISNPQSAESRIMALAAAQPDRYKLSVILSRELPDSPEELWLRNEQGALVDNRKIWSPQAPIAALEAMAKLRAEPLAQIRKRAPISVVLNGGEYGLEVLGAIQRFCLQDPKVLAARGNRDWFEYISERKAYQESFVAKSVRQLVPERRLYVYYPTDSNPHRGRYAGWVHWCYDYKYMKANSDFPNSSTYFKEYNTGWTGSMDILTQVLNSVGQQIKFGDPLSYNWVCSGWMRNNTDPVFGEIDRYLGFLKCYYTAGMLGGIAGYFDLPKNGGFEATFAAENPPNWIQQMVALSRVHAQFSYLESFLRQGDLLPGPMKHIWSKDAPAYEFPTADPDVRVLARKHRQKNDWLITAWAAAGSSRKVIVEIPQLGRVSLLARSIGSVYTAKIAADRAKLTWIDAR